MTINWDKSVDPIKDPLPSGISQLQVANKTKYLGIYITRDPKLYITNNLAALEVNLKHKGGIWCCFPVFLFSVVGQYSLIKMIWMPQLLYALHNWPVWIPKQWFQKIDTIKN